MLNKIVFFVFFAFVLVIGLENCSTLGKSQYSTNKVQAENYLAAYGEFVFEREPCKSCHTLNTDEQSANLISLDGFGGKYSSNWLYYFLSDPKKFMDKPIMPSHVHLHDKLIDKSTFATIVEAKGTKRQNRKFDRVWNKLLLQADELSMEIPLIKTGNPDRTEVLALISYLQQIPSSPSKITVDSLIHVKLREKEHSWENFVLDENSITLQVAQNPESIEKGKSIYAANCASCHGFKGEGGTGPNLTDEFWLNGGTDLDIARTIIYGAVKKGMLSWHFKVNPTEAGELLAYIKSLSGTNPENAKYPEGVKN